MNVLSVTNKDICKIGDIMAKIENDKYYTSPDLAEYCVNKTKEIIGEINITEYIEPSAGQGAFLDYLDKPYLAYDIEPEDNKIIKADWLSVNLNYKKGRCIIGNPPFGKANSLLKKFYKKSIEVGDYISFIMPISQLDNNQELYQYDLIYSEDLGVREYSGVKRHCCLNIYKKPSYKKEKPIAKLQDIEFIGWRKAKNTECDFYICCYGASTGKIVERNSNLVNINGVIIHNRNLYDRILKVFKETNWAKIYNMSTPLNLLRWQIVKHLKEQIPELN